MAVVVEQFFRYQLKLKTNETNEKIIDDNVACSCGIPGMGFR